MQVIERISVRDEYVRISDEKTLKLILEQLRGDFLFVPVEDFAIEVHQEDVEPLRQQLIAIKKQLMQKVSQG